MVAKTLASFGEWWRFGIGDNWPGLTSTYANDKSLNPCNSKQNTKMVEICQERGFRLDTVVNQPFQHNVNGRFFHGHT